MAERLKVEIAKDKSKARVTFLPASGASGALDLSADQLLELIQQLGNIHKALTEGQPLPELKGKRIKGVLKTKWHVNPELMGEASALSFYHPSFGPVGFLMPMDEVEMLVGLLSAQVEDAKASRSKPQ
jgi:hypothetical protein